MKIRRESNKKRKRKQKIKRKRRKSFFVACKRAIDFVVTSSGLNLTTATKKKPNKQIF
jgi:hypothetical protein